MKQDITVVHLLIVKGTTIRILGAGVFLEINIFMGKMGEINKWPQVMVEIQPILRGKNKAFYPPCEINKNCQAKTPAPPPPRYLMVAPLSSNVPPQY